MVVIQRTCCGALVDRISTDGEDIKVRREDDIQYFFPVEDGLRVYETKRVVYDCLNCGAIKAVSIIRPTTGGTWDHHPEYFIKEDGRVVEGAKTNER